MGDQRCVKLEMNNRIRKKQDEVEEKLPIRRPRYWELARATRSENIYLKCNIPKQNFMKTHTDYSQRT